MKFVIHRTDINPSSGDPYSKQVTAQAIDFLYRGLPRVGGTVLVPIVVAWIMWQRIDHADALAAQISGATAQSLLGNINRSIEALTQLLGSLLDISKLDADIIKPSLAHFPLAVLLDQLDSEYAPQAHAKGLSWHVDTANLIAYSDPVLLETLLRNLISNALRYTHSGGIQVLCTNHNSEISIAIVDSVVGIPADQQQDIFREFYQLENPERDRSKGLGLGLAIVDRLATLLRHRITLDAAPGQGSRFSVTLPGATRRRWSVWQRNSPSTTSAVYASWS